MIAKSARVNGLIVVVLHLALVSSLAGKYLYERATRPRVWVESVNYDPTLPVRGRYLSLRLKVDAPGVFKAPPLEEDKALVSAKRKNPPCANQEMDDEMGGRYRYSRQSEAVRLEAENGHLVAKADSRSDVYAEWERDSKGVVTIEVSQPVAFFISEHAFTPASLRKGEQLWAEVTVPKKGPPRPVRLGIRQANGEIKPLSLQ